MSIRMTRVQRNRLKEIERQVDAGLLPEDVREFLRIAKEGDHDTNQIFHGYERKVNKGSQIAGSWLMTRLGSLPPIARRSSSSDDPSIVYEDPAAPLPPQREPANLTELPKKMKKAAREISRPQDRTPLKHIKSLLSEFGFTPDVDGYDNAFEFATAQVARRFSYELRKAIRPNHYAPFHMPPRPRSDGFGDGITRLLSADRDVIREWQAWDGWSLVLIDMFAVILADGILQGNYQSLADRRKAEIALKRAWYEDLKSTGLEWNEAIEASDDIGSYDLEGASRRLYYKPEDAEIRKKIAAEFSRFDSSVRADFQVDGQSIKLFVDDMLKLHQEALDLMGPDFTDLITPYVIAPTQRDIFKLLDRKDVPNDVQRLMAKTVLAWHTYSAQGFAGWISDTVLGRYPDSRDINDFCLNAFGFTRGMISRDGRVPAALMHKLENMASEGAKLSLLLTRLEKRFPGAVAPEKAKELLRIAREKRAGAVAMDIATPQAPAAVAYAVSRTRGNGPRKLKPRGTVGGTQLSLDFTTARYMMAGGIANFSCRISRLPTLPGPRTSMNMGLGLMHLNA